MEFMCHINSLKNAKTVYFEDAFFSSIETLLSLKLNNAKQL